MRRSIPTARISLTVWRLILLANIHMLEFFVWLADYQQAMLAKMDHPRSPRIDDRKAELDRELLKYRTVLQCL